LSPLRNDLLAQLASFTTPTLANAIEAIGTRSHADGYMDASIACRFADLPHLIGYAATARVVSSTKGSGLPGRELWAHIASVFGPRVVVIEDVDEKPGHGSYWGEVNANVHRALGCVGVITSGAVRDLVEMQRLGFHAFSASIAVSHAYVRLVEVGIPVTVGGLVVHPGDLLHGDRHGVLQIPIDLASRLPEAARAVETAERRVIEYCQSPEFSAQGLSDLMLKVFTPTT
jgi:regulator of RNase E activity RraA